MVTDDKEIVLGQLSIETDEKEQQLKIDKCMVDRQQSDDRHDITRQEKADRLYMLIAY